MSKTVVALYNEITSAQQAVDRLVSNGFARDQISLMANDTSNTYSKYLDTPENRIESTGDAVTAGEGAGFGATVGALTGIVVGLGAFIIPGIGPVLGAGPVVAGLAGLTGGVVGAVAGGATGGIVGGLVKTGISPEDADYYVEGVRRGGTLVVVHTADADAQKAQNVLNDFDPVDINERGTAWRESGWTGSDANAAPYTPEEVDSYRKAANVPRDTIPGTRTDRIYDLPEDAKNKTF